MKFTKKIYVSGIGTVSSIGIGINEFNKSLIDGVCGIRRMNNSSICKYFANMKEFSFEEQLKKLEKIPNDMIKKAKVFVRRRNDIVKSSCLAAMEAYVDSGLNDIVYDRNKIGLIIAGSNLSQVESFEMNKKYSDNQEFIPSSYALNYLDTNILGVISEMLNIHGEGFSVGGASASGNLGIVKGAQLIKLGIVDVCVIVGPMTKLSPLELSAFKNLSVIGSQNKDDNGSKVYSPFDKSQDGFVPGEASSCIILESEQSMINRGKEREIELCSAISFLDGNRLTDPSLDGEKNVMEKVVKDAHVNIEDINYINAHGTGTPLGDKCEIKAIEEVFGDKVFVNSTKSFIGHCLYSAGITEAIATILQMKNNFVHTNLNLCNPIENSINLVQGRNINTKIKYAINNAFGFSGINTSILLRNNR